MSNEIAAQVTCSPLDNTIREKIWPERNTEEKLQALRDTVEVLLHRLTDAEQTIWYLRGHMHSPSGDIVIFMRSAGPASFQLSTERVPIALRDRY